MGWLETLLDKVIFRKQKCVMIQNPSHKCTKNKDKQANIKIISDLLPIVANFDLHLFEAIYIIDI